MNGTDSMCPLIDTPSMILHISIPNKKSVMVSLGHSRLWVENGIVTKLMVKYMKVSS